MAGAALLFVAVPLSATPAPVRSFSECQNASQPAGCSYLIEFNKDGSISLLSDPSLKDADSKDDVYIGMLNHSGKYIGLGNFTGPNNAFWGLHLTGGLADGESTYFEMKDPLEDDNDQGGEDDDNKNVTPEPGSMLLLGTGLIAVGGLLKQQRKTVSQI